jgi:hypothetical protein
MDADGELWRAGGALGRWRLAATAPGFPVQKLAALDGSSAWVGGSETGHVPVFALLGHEGWEAPAPGLTAGSVVALDAASSLDAYALVAPEASGPIKARVVWVQAACAGRPCISEWRSPVNLTAVSSPAPGSAWAVGEHVVVHCAGSACTQEVPALVPAGARLVDVVAATDDDVWVAALSGKVGRESTRILRRGEAGVWSMPCGLDVPIAKLDLARSGMPGGQTLWMAGDWSTVLRLDYAVGEPVPGCD